MTPVSRFFVLQNQIILAKSIIHEDVYELQDPYLVFQQQGQVAITPYLQDIIGQEVKHLEISKDKVLAVLPAETKNEILQTYLKQISGIDTGPELILG